MSYQCHTSPECVLYDLTKSAWDHYPTRILLVWYLDRLTGQNYGEKRKFWKKWAFLKTHFCPYNKQALLGHLVHRLRAVAFFLVSWPRARESVKWRGRETRETRAAAREAFPECLSRLAPSVTRVCILARFVRRTKQKERLLVVYLGHQMDSPQAISSVCTNWTDKAAYSRKLMIKLVGVFVSNIFFYFRQSVFARSFQEHSFELQEGPFQLTSCVDSWNVNSFSLQSRLKDRCSGNKPKYRTFPS